MKRLRYTPLVNMRMRSVLAGLKDIVPQLAAIYECPPSQVDVELWKFIEVSFLIECENGELGFDLLAPTDSAEVVAEKFARYLDADMQVVKAAQALLVAPADPVTGPVPPEAGAKKN